MVECYCHDIHCYTGFAQILVTFFIGVLFAGWSYGFLFLLISIVLWEIWRMYIHRWEYCLRIERPLVILSAFAGWGIGRLIVNLDPLESGKDKMKEMINSFMKYIGG